MLAAQGQLSWMLRRRWRPPRPRARPEDQPGLAPEGRLPHLLAAALRSASTGLTSTSTPAARKEARPTRSESVRTGHYRATAPWKANRQQTRNQAPAQSITGPRER